MRFSSFPNRTLCDVLSEMRKCNETLNFSQLMSLIEEAQMLGNRMEAALGDKGDIREWSEERSKLKSEIKELMEEKKVLTKEKEELQIKEKSKILKVSEGTWSKLQDRLKDSPSQEMVSLLKDLESGE